MKFTAIEVVDGDRFEGPWEGVGESLQSSSFDRPTGAPERIVPARLSQRPSWVAYMQTCDLAVAWELTVKALENVTDLYPRPALVPAF